MHDLSNGYEDRADAYRAGRRRSDIGVDEIRAWSRQFPRGSSILDLGCGDGTPISEALIAEGLSVFGIDASPSMVAAYRRRFPGVPVACEGVEDSPFFARSFDGAVAWGLLFLLSAETQRKVISKVAASLHPGGRFCFTSPAPSCTWDDVLTGRRSLSLGADMYRKALDDAGLMLIAESDDEGDNHYYYAVKSSATGP